MMRALHAFLLVLAALAPGGPTDDPGATGQVEPTPSDALPTDEPTAEP